MLKKADGRNEKLDGAAADVANRAAGYRFGQQKRFDCPIELFGAKQAGPFPKTFAAKPPKR